MKKRKEEKTSKEEKKRREEKKKTEEKKYKNKKVKMRSWTKTNFRIHRNIGVKKQAMNTKGILT